MSHYTHSTEGLQEILRDRFGRESKPIKIEPISQEGEFGGKIIGEYYLTTDDSHCYKLKLSGTQEVSFFANPKNFWEEIIDIEEV